MKRFSVLIGFLSVSLTYLAYFLKFPTTELSASLPNPHIPEEFDLGLVISSEPSVSVSHDFRIPLPKNSRFREFQLKPATCACSSGTSPERVSARDGVVAIPLSASTKGSPMPVQMTWKATYIPINSDESDQELLVLKAMIVSRASVGSSKNLNSTIDVDPEAESAEFQVRVFFYDGEEKDRIQCTVAGMNLDVQKYEVARVIGVECHSVRFLINDSSVLPQQSEERAIVPYRVSWGKGGNQAKEGTLTLLRRSKFRTSPRNLFVRRLPIRESDQPKRIVIESDVPFEIDGVDFEGVKWESIDYSSSFSNVHTVMLRKLLYPNDEIADSSISIRINSGSEQMSLQVPILIL